MELHNTAEDLVLSRISEICDSIEKKGNIEKLCTCAQCRMDTACYVLNRTTPHYIVSNRGAARAEQGTIEKQQKEADIVTLIYEGLSRVNHNQRPNFDHGAHSGNTIGANVPVYNIPTIMGRLFDGANFAPISEVKVELYHNGELVTMKDSNWQNPYHMVHNTEGTFTFWPNPILAESPNSHKVFEFTLKVESPNFETLNHFFKIPVISDIQTASSFSLTRTVKLPDLYMFPPGGDEDDNLL
jgi:competence protein ComFB